MPPPRKADTENLRAILAKWDNDIGLARMRINSLGIALSFFCFPVGVMSNRVACWTGREPGAIVARKFSGRTSMGLFSDLFTWWNGSTLSTRLYTQRHGRAVGEDAFGNSYYEDKGGIGPAGRPRRWVIYRGEADASKVPPEWHGWLHYIVDEPPSHDYQAKSWQKPHVENKTGTPEAYRPAGSIMQPGRRRPAAPDYEPWRAE